MRIGTPSEEQRRAVALVTGASRGIGKAIAIRLGREGYAVACLARTVHEGEAREHSPTVARSDSRPLPGSLDTTVGAISEGGTRALPVVGDLLDPPSLDAAVDRVLDEWGRIDVLVNNARYIGPGHMDRLLDTPLSLLDDHLQANVMAPLRLCQRVLPGMVDRGSGAVVNITSSVAYEDPPAPAGEGGWGLGYGMSKGAFHRIAGFIAVELGDRGIRAFNVQPGFVATERIAIDMGDFGFDANRGAPAEVVGAVVAYLLGPNDLPNGTTVQAQELAAELGLVPGWPH